MIFPQSCFQEFFLKPAICKKYTYFSSFGGFFYLMGVQLKTIALMT